MLIAFSLTGATTNNENNNNENESLWKNQYISGSYQRVMEKEDDSDTKYNWKITIV